MCLYPVYTPLFRSEAIRMPDVWRSLGRRPLSEASRPHAHGRATVRVPHVPGGAHRRTHTTQTHGQVSRGQPAREDHAGEGHPAVSQPGHPGGARRQHPGIRPASGAPPRPAAALRGDRDGADHRGDGGGRAGCSGRDRRLHVNAVRSGHHAGGELRPGTAGDYREQAGGGERT